MTRNPEFISSESSNEPNPWDSLSALSYNDTPNSPENSLPELPTSSPNQYCKYYLKAIDSEGRMDDVKTFLESSLRQEYHDFSSDTELDQFCYDYSKQLLPNLSSEEVDALKSYSGYDYKYINQVARGQWSYELLGPQTPEKLASTKRTIEQIDRAISNAPDLETNVIAYRGTNIESFLGYGIHSLSDLTSLQNQFFIERGFTSTSLDSNHSFANRKDFDDPLRRSCDIAIEYLIPANSGEVIGLFSESTNYNPEQRELLINQSSLSYISNVEINPDQTSAKLQMILIPRHVYDPVAK